MTRSWLLIAVACAGCERAATAPVDAPPPIDAAPIAVVKVPPPPPRSAGPLLLVRDGMVILGKPRGARGPARLDVGDFPVDEDGPQAEHGTFTASRSVDPARVSMAQRAWIGRTLLLGGPSGRCIGAVTALRVTAEVYGLDEIDGETEAELAAGVLAHGRPVLAGVLTAPCLDGAAWAVPSESLVPIAQGTTGGSPSSRVNLVIDDDGCPGRTTYALTAGNQTLLEGSDPIDVRDVIDIDHDGWPEIILADGWLQRDGTRGGYRRVTVVHIPEDWYACIE